MRVIENPDYIYVDPKKLLADKTDETTDIMTYALRENIITTRQYSKLRDTYYTVRFGSRENQRNQIKQIKFYLLSPLAESYIKKIKRGLLDMIDLAEQLGADNRDRSFLTTIEGGPEMSESMRQIKRNMAAHSARKARLKKNQYRDGKKYKK